MFASSETSGGLRTGAAVISLEQTVIMAEKSEPETLQGAETLRRVGAGKTGGRQEGAGGRERDAG